MAAPVSAVLISIVYCASGAEFYMSGRGLDGDHVFWHHLRQATTVSYIAFICFLIGAFSLLLPVKTHANVP